MSTTTDEIHSPCQAQLRNGEAADATDDPSRPSTPISDPGFQCLPEVIAWLKPQGNQLHRCEHHHTAITADHR